MEFFGKTKGKNEIEETENAKSVIKEAVEAILPPKTDELDCAIDIFKGDKFGEWDMVKIKYDIEKGTAEIVEVVRLGDGQHIAQYKAKELFTKKIMGIR